MKFSKLWEDSDKILSNALVTVASHSQKKEV